MEEQEIWKNVLGDIELQISKPNFLTWLKNSQLVGLNKKEGVVMVGLPNNFAKEWVKSRYHKLILTSIRNLDGSIKNIDYVVVNSSRTGIDDKKTTQAPKRNAPQSSLIDVKVDPKTNLNPKYSFKNYIVGSSNELATAAAQAIIKNIGKKYNPLFIYGGVGLGKTHLLQATGNEIIGHYKGSVSVLYISSEKFINDVVWALRNKRTDDMKKKYRDIDVLIIDDIQFIGGKAATEQEFFYTFNTLSPTTISDRRNPSVPTKDNVPFD